MDDDVISHLPRDILDRIVSRLDLRDALRTNLLSRRWRDISSSFAPSMVRCAPVNFRVSCSVTVLRLFFDGDTSFDLSSICVILINFPRLKRLILQACPC